MLTLKTATLSDNAAETVYDEIGVSKKEDFEIECLGKLSLKWYVTMRSIINTKLC